MSLRKKLNESPVLTACVVIAVIAGVVWWSVKQLGDDGLVRPATKAYFTVDDGKTFFVDDVDRVCPFDYNGKQAVRAMVYSCDSGKTQFVGYLQKLTPEYKVKAEEALAEKKKALAEGKAPPMGGDSVFGVLIKKPGDADWYPSASQGGTMASNVVCPAGGILEMQFPR